MPRTRSQAAQRERRRAREAVWVDVEVVEDRRQWLNVAFEPQEDPTSQVPSGDSSSESEFVDVEILPPHPGGGERVEEGEMGDREANRHRGMADQPNVPDFSTSHSRARRVPTLMSGWKILLGLSKLMGKRILN
ncbi:unnamed protein product [Calypogeia fissa]